MVRQYPDSGVVAGGEQCRIAQKLAEIAQRSALTKIPLGDNLLPLFHGPRDRGPVRMFWLNHSAGCRSYAVPR